MGPVGDPEFPNIWPEDSSIPGFQSWMEHYFEKSQQLSMQLMRALEIAMNLPAGSLTDLCEGHASELRLNHYPETHVARFQDGKAKRIWPHTDFGIITLLAQDSEGGLEIQDKDKPGTFVPVPLVDKTELVVNVGDTLERWTNGILKAGLHQVTVPRALQGEILPTRYSVAFFLKANRRASVGSIRMLVPEGCTATYEDMTALEYQQRRTNIVY
jgi:isopenicillin N synthase-like dioxygenase